MKTKTKILLSMTFIFFLLGFTNIINIFFNFKHTIVSNAFEKSELVANIVKDGLTAHMVNNTMPKRKYFLDQISKNNEIKSLWIIRGDNVKKQYGDGFIDENIQDKIDETVLKNGKTQQILTENINEMILRVTIPYIATHKNESIDCLSCHNVQEGDTLGAISMEFDISKLRTNGAVTLLKIISINLIFVTLILLLINYYISPFTRLLYDLQEGIKKASKGDFNYRFNTTLNGEAKNIINQVNSLFKKMQETFGDVKYSLAAFTSGETKDSDNPLDEASKIIHELADIYKFKKTIELDLSLEIVYSRIVEVFKEKYNIKYFAIYEINDKSKNRKIIYMDKESDICYESIDENILECRAYRTKINIISTEFSNLCQGCKVKEAHYSCFFYNINEQHSIVVSMTSKDKNEIKKLNKKIPHLKNYLEAAKPVIESKLLMQKLKETSLKDGMTGLYNRRFLEEFIEKFMSQANRNQDTYHVLMLDVDLFKEVNDTYGHDVGDMVIIEISKLLQKHIRNSDIAIRYGGEEFIVMLQKATDEGAMMVAENLLSKFSTTKFNVGGGKSISKTISIGISKFPTDSDSIWKCIKYADTALYHAKRTGRNKIVEFKMEMFDKDNE